MKIQRVGANTKPNMAMCLFAIPGYGKTQFIGSGEDVVIIRPPQDHTDSIRSPAERNIREIVVTSHEDLDEIVVMASNGDFDDMTWVWCDSISLLQDVTLDALHQVDQDSNPKMRGRMPDKGTYGINMHRLAAWVRAMAGFSTFNFGVTAHPFWGKNIDDDEILMPYVQGKNMPEKLCGSMNVVAFLDIKEMKTKGEDKATSHRVMYFNATDRFYAKDQFDAFPNGRLVDPTMPAFEKAIKTARARNAGAPTKRTPAKRRPAAKRSK